MRQSKTLYKGDCSLEFQVFSSASSNELMQMIDAAVNVTSKETKDRSRRAGVSTDCVPFLSFKSMLP